MDTRKQFEAALSEEVYLAAWRYAWRLAGSGRGGCQQDAEDLLQEALSHAWRQFGQLRERGQFKAWLLCIVRTRYLNMLRTRRRRPDASAELAQDIPGAAPGESFEQQEAQAALSQLPAAERQLLALFYIEGLSLEETGQALGVRSGLLRQRLFRARQNLRRVLERMNGTHAQPRPGTTARRTEL